MQYYIHNHCLGGSFAPKMHLLSTLKRIIKEIKHYALKLSHKLLLACVINKKWDIYTCS